MMMIDKLINRIKSTENPTVVGLDPNQDFIPKFIMERVVAKYGWTLKAMGKAILIFNKMIIDEIYDLVPAVKPQIAMYERYGISGLKAYVKTIEYAKKKGLIVIGDIKRSDIASTGQAYSDGHIGRAKVGLSEFEVFKEDFITLNPYLGSDSITPFINDCKSYGKGLFVLAKTSNPNSGEIQDLIIGDVPLYEKVGELISKWGEELIGENGFSEAPLTLSKRRGSERLCRIRFSLFRDTERRVAKRKTLPYVSTKTVLERLLIHQEELSPRIKRSNIRISLQKRNSLKRQNRRLLI